MIATRNEKATAFFDRDLNKIVLSFGRSLGNGYVTADQAKELIGALRRARRDARRARADFRGALRFPKPVIYDSEGNPLCD